MDDMIPFLRLLILALLALNTGRLVKTAEAQASSFKSFSKNSAITTILVSSHGHVLAGGVDNIWHLSDELALVAHVQSGPANDSATCGPPPTRNCSSPSSFAPSNDTILVLEQGLGPNDIIACGTLYMGACQVLDGRNISAAPIQSYEPQLAGRVLRSDISFASQTRAVVKAEQKLFILANSQFVQDTTPQAAVLTFTLPGFNRLSPEAVIKYGRSAKHFPSQWTAAFGHREFAYFIYNTQVR